MDKNALIRDALLKINDNIKFLSDDMDKMQKINQTRIPTHREELLNNAEAVKKLLEEL